MARRLVDASFIVTDETDVKRCCFAFIATEALSVQGHHGYIIKVDVIGDTLGVILRHTGPPSCKCKEVPTLHDDL